MKSPNTYKFLSILLVVVFIFLCAPQAKAEVVVEAIKDAVEDIAPIIEVILMVAAVLVLGVAAGVIIAQAGLLAAPAIFTTFVGMGIVTGTMIGAGLWVADCLFDGSAIDPDIICVGTSEGGAGFGPESGGQSALEVDVRVDGSNGPITFRAPATFQIQWAIAGADSLTNCVATGDWSGDIDNATGGTTLSDVVRGNYNYGIRCVKGGGETDTYGSWQTTLSDSYSAWVGADCGGWAPPNPDWSKDSCSGDTYNLYSCGPTDDKSCTDMRYLGNLIGCQNRSIICSVSLTDSCDGDNVNAFTCAPSDNKTCVDIAGADYRNITCVANGENEASDSVAVQVENLPSCTFSSSPKTIVKPGKSILFWECQYADSCQISNGATTTVNNTGGTLEVRPTEPTNYILTCSNIDGPIHLITEVDVLEPSIHEVPPGGE